MKKSTLRKFVNEAVSAALPLAASSNHASTASNARSSDGAGERGGHDHGRVDCTGRRPASLRPDVASHGGDEVGELFARMAYLEDASVHAFRTLRAELSLHGAPAQLVDDAERAAADEVRHAKVTARLAERFGASPVAAEVATAPQRSLEEMAVENMAEGCVREGFGALVASYQARTAGDHAVRLALAVLSVDETSHAALAWKVAAWAGARLDEAGRKRVDEARKEALFQLAADLENEPAPSLVERCGLPSRVPARALFAAFSADVERRAASMNTAPVTFSN